MKGTLILIISMLVIGNTALGQQKEIKYNLNESGDNYIKFTGLGQIWLRNTQMNPNTTINSEETDAYSDISIRRLRFQLYGQITDKVFFYTQFGQNNFNYHSDKQVGAFFHDATAEYKAMGEKLSIGAGLTGWSGLSRYASPSVASFLTLDAPLYQQVTNGVNDQFLRKLSLYAKGQLGQLDYRIAISQPMTITGLGTGVDTPTSGNFSFSNLPANKQYQGYFKWMFFDKESNLTPYQTGSYLGTKKVFNIGAGFIHQKDAMWALEGPNTILHDMTLFGIDVFYDAPLSDSKAITAYLAYTSYDFGDNFIRNVGVNNAATGANGPAPGGFGNAFPMIGTGSTLYAEVGLLLGNDLWGPGGKAQPFVAFQQSYYDYLADQMFMYQLGANYFLKGTHNGKLSVMYQNRPVYETNAGERTIDTRKGMTVIQYQVAF
jgi:hypothetical protein